MVRLGNKYHKWTRHEDDALISSLTKLCQNGWKRDNNVFKNGYTSVLEKELKSKIPGCNLKANPHIESRVRVLKKHCDAITEMKDVPGIKWRTTDRTLVCYDDEAWDKWCKDHSIAKGLRNKQFPYYDELCLIFGKNRDHDKNVEDESDADRGLAVYETNGYIENVNNESDHEELNVHNENDMVADESHGGSVPIDDSHGDVVPIDNSYGDEVPIDDSQAANKKGQRLYHKWTSIEDDALISALKELCRTGWKRDNNVFKNGYTSALEKELKSRLPGFSLKANSQIESRIRILKRHCDAITDMKDVPGIEWRTTDCTLVCYDDDAWDNWIKDHPDGKGLRNKQFPYYDDLCLIFGKNQGHHKNVEEASDANGVLEVYETHGYEENENNEYNHEEPNSHKENDMVTDDSHSDEVPIDVSHGHEVPIDVSHSHEVPIYDSQAANKKVQSCSSGTEGLVKIIEVLLKKQEEQFSILAGIVGREVKADNAVADKRGRLNGELKRIPNLSLQARLRAASVLVGDSAKLDLFYSLSIEERKEWVSMLLSGLI